MKHIFTLLNTNHNNINCMFFQ